MLVTYEVSGPATLIVSVFGDLGEDQAPELIDQLLAFVDMGFQRTLVDTARCRFTDWSGLDVLVAAARHADGREVGILAPTRGLRRLLDATGLSVALPQYASRSALAEPARAEPARGAGARRGVRAAAPPRHGGSGYSSSAATAGTAKEDAGPAEACAARASAAARCLAGSFQTTRQTPAAVATAAASRP